MTEGSAAGRADDEAALPLRRPFGGIGRGSAWELP